MSVTDCVPQGPTARPVMNMWLCRCGEPLRPVDPGTGLEWAYVSDTTGLTYRDDRPPLLIEDPARWWQELAKNNIGAYSNLTARTALGYWSWFHYHQPHRPHPDAKPAGPLPWCHGQPMWATTRGWRCRVFKALFPYADEEADQ